MGRNFIGYMFSAFMATMLFGAIAYGSVLRGDPSLIAFDVEDEIIDPTNPYAQYSYNDNSRNVAQELFWLANSSIGPNADQQILLTDFLALQCPDAGFALENLSGPQYSSLLLSTELTTRQFARRLYDPLRASLTLDPICDDEEDCCYKGINVWADAGATYACFGNTHQACGFTNRGYHVTFGGQIAPERDCVVGTGFSYQHTNSTFNLAGTGDTKSFFGALYGSYRICNMYVLGEGILGGSVSNVKRSFRVGPEHYFEKGKPESFQGMLYAEMGRNFHCGSFVIQPFLGLEGGYYFYKHFHENGDDVTELKFHRRRYGTFDTRLGVHLSSGQICTGLYVGVDLAWQYRCTTFNGYLDNRFVDSISHVKEDPVTLEEEKIEEHEKREQEEEQSQREGHGKHKGMKIPKPHKPSEIYYRSYAMNLDPNSFTAAINVEQEIMERWTIYFTGNWQQWSNASAFDALAGISFTW